MTDSNRAFRSFKNKRPSLQAPFLAITLVACGLTSCSTKHPPTGHIYLDHGEVFTRERLVNSRLNDLKWLETQLAVSNASTIQGAQFQSLMTGFTGQLSAQFAPLGGLSSVGGLAMPGLTQPPAPLSPILSQIQNTILQQILSGLQTNFSAYSNMLGSNYLASFLASPASSAGGSNAPVTVNLPSNAAPSFPSSSNLIVAPGGPVQLTPIEQFQDQLAYRDAVSGEIRERELDDTHDHNGMTLYTLAFHVSVVPGEANSALGNVSASFTGPHFSESSPVTPESSKLYARWLEAFRRTFDQEVIGIQRRFLANYLTDEDKREIYIDCWKAQDSTRSKKGKAIEKLIGKPNGSKSANLLEITEIEKLHPEEFTNYDAAIGDFEALENALGGQSGALTTNIDTNALRGLARAVEWRFDDAVNKVSGKLVGFGFPGQTSKTTNDYMWLVPVEPNEDGDGPANFVAALARLAESPDTSLPMQDFNQAFVYDIEPKNYNQNLSDQSMKQNSLNLSLGLAAAVPQISTSLSAYFDYIKQSQKMLETIKRKPLLVSYIQDSNTFGWLIGPRFMIQNKKLDLGYEQIPVQEAVQVVIEVPAWWPSVTIHSTNQWLKSDTTAYSNKTTVSKTFEMRLRPDLDAITQAFLEREDPTFANPQIYPIWNPDPAKRGYAVSTTSPSTQILILGRNLWRNPRVFIGTQASSGQNAYSLLPDMQGIVATFNSISSPLSLSTNASGAATADLRIVTSDGESVLQNAVSIVSPGTVPGGLAPFVSISNFWAVIGSNYSFNANMNVAGNQTGRFDLDLGLLYETPTAVAQGAGNIFPQNGVLTFSMPSNWPVPLPAQAYVDVTLKTAPNADPKSILIGGKQSIVLFGNAAQTQFSSVTSNWITSTNPSVAATNPGVNVVTIQVPNYPSSTSGSNLFWAAWPGLQAALNHGSNAAIQLTPAANPKPIIASTSGQFSAASGQFTFTLNSNLLTSNAIVALTSATSPFTASVIIPATNPQWTNTITGPIVITRQ